MSSNSSYHFRRRGHQSRRRRSPEPMDRRHFRWMTSNFRQILSLFKIARTKLLFVLKADLMSALAKEVKSLDEDNWMFEGPRSRINLISKTGCGYPLHAYEENLSLSALYHGAKKHLDGGFLKNAEILKQNLPLPKQN